MIQETYLYIYKHEGLKNYLKKKFLSQWEDAHSELIADVIEKIPTCKLQQYITDDTLMFYVFGMSRHMLINRTSPFNMAHNNNVNFVDKIELSTLYDVVDESYNEDQVSNDFDEDVQELCQDVSTFLSGRTKRVSGAFYDEILFNRKFKQNLTYEEMSKATKIPAAEIFNSIGATKQMLSTKFQDRYDGLIN